MRKNKVRVGLIGCGKRLQGMVKRLVGEYPGVQVAAVCDPSGESVRETLEKFNPRAAVYEDFRELVNDGSLDWALIGSWNRFHREQVVAALEAGKHVFCEKPLATSLEDCLAMKAAWEKSGLLFTIGFTLRYSPHYRRIVEIVRAGGIGEITSMEFNETLDFNHGGYIMGDWRRQTENAGTHLLEKCCHDIDLVNWVLNSRTARVASFGGRDFFGPENREWAAGLGTNDKGREAYRTWPGKVCENPFTSDKDIVDNQVAIMEYENGVRATFHTNSNTIIPERRMYICGKRGTLRADVLTGRLEVQRIGFNTERETVGTIKGSGHGGGDIVLVRELGEAMLNGRKPAAGLIEGLLSAVTCFGIDKAMETGTVVDMAEMWRKCGIGDQSAPPPVPTPARKQSKAISCP